MVENLRQGARADATDFMILVGTSVSNLGKDWKDQLTDEELQSLQYEVSLNGVKEEIRHVLDSEIARHGPLTPHQMYEAVKKYKTYVARNKRLEGKSASPHTNHQRAVPQTSGYKPHFHKTTAFAASVEENTDSAPTDLGPSLPEEEGHPEVEPNQEDNEGLFIPNFSEEALGGDGNLQIKMARTMQALEKQERRCFICQVSRSPDEGSLSRKKWERAPPAEGASPKQIGSRDGQSLSARSSNFSRSPSKVKSAPYLNPNRYCQFIGPKNLGEVLIDGELTTCLLDNGAQINFVTPTYARQRRMDIMSLDHLAQEIGGQIPPIAGIGGIMVEPEGFVMMNVQVPCVKGYNEDQIAIVMEDPGLKDFQVILGTATIYRVMEVIKESEISELVVPWASSRLSWLMRDVHARMSQMIVNDVANKSMVPLSVDEVVRVSHKCKVPPFGHKVIHGSVSLVLQGYRMNVMTHGLEKRSPLLPLGIDVQSAYATLSTGSNRVAVVLRNNTRDWIEIGKGTPVVHMVAANQVPQVIDTISADKPKEQPTLTETERQALLLDKLDLSGLEAWPTEQAEKACGLLREYHDIFSLEKHDMGHTNATKHKIVLKDPDTLPFKEHFRRIPPPQLDEVREHLKLMLDAGVVRPSNSPWCNTVVLVRKKDGSLRFCIDFRRLNALTVKDSPLASYL